MKTGRLWLIGLLAAAAAWPVAGSEPSTKGTSMTVNLRLDARQPVYAPDASVVVDVAIEKRDVRHAVMARDGIDRGRVVHERGTGRND